jgi:hypothetical protein
MDYGIWTVEYTGGSCFVLAMATAKRSVLRLTWSLRQMRTKSLALYDESTFPSPDVKESSTDYYHEEHEGRKG